MLVTSNYACLIVLLLIVFGRISFADANTPDPETAPSRPDQDLKVSSQLTHDDWLEISGYFDRIGAQLVCDVEGQDVIVKTAPNPRLRFDLTSISIPMGIIHTDLSKTFCRLELYGRYLGRVALQPSVAKLGDLFVVAATERGLFDGSPQVLTKRYRMANALRIHHRVNAALGTQVGRDYQKITPLDPALLLCGGESLRAQYQNVMQLASNPMVLEFLRLKPAVPADSSMAAEVPEVEPSCHVRINTAEGIILGANYLPGSQEVVRLEAVTGVADMPQSLETQLPLIKSQLEHKRFGLKRWQVLGLDILVDRDLQYSYASEITISSLDLSSKTMAFDVSNSPRPGVWHRLSVPWQVDGAFLDKQGAWGLSSGAMQLRFAPPKNNEPLRLRIAIPLLSAPPHTKYLAQQVLLFEEVKP